MGEEDLFKSALTLSDRILSPNLTMNGNKRVKAALELLYSWNLFYNPQRDIKNEYYTRCLRIGACHIFQ